MLTLELITKMRNDAQNGCEVAKDFLRHQKTKIENYLNKADERHAKEAKKEAKVELNKAFNFFAAQYRRLLSGKFEGSEELSQNGKTKHEAIKSLKFVKNHFDLLGLMKVDNCIKLFRKGGQIELKELIDLCFKFDEVTNEATKIEISKRGDKIFELLKDNKENGFSFKNCKEIVKTLQHDIMKPKDKRRDYIPSKDFVKLIIHNEPKNVTEGHIVKFAPLEGGDTFSGFEAYLKSTYNISYIDFKALTSQKIANSKSLLELIELRNKQRAKIVNEQSQKPTTKTTKKDAAKVVA